MKAYKHSQLGYEVIIILLLGLFATILVVYINGMDAVNFLIIIALLLVLFVFSRLHIIITENKVVTYFNLKLFKKTILYEDIQGVKIVNIPFYYGWGIRFFLKGKMYRVSGKKAIQFDYKNGKFFMVGTDNSLVMLREILHFLKK